MADDPEAPRLDTPEEEDEGGPVKSFLEHLEDLRWVLIKSLTAAGVAMLACLLAGNVLIEVLKWPLQRAPALHTPKGQVAWLTLGTNQLGPFHVATNEPYAALMGTNRFARFEVVPMPVGTNFVLGLNVVQEADADALTRLGSLQAQLKTFGPVAAFIIATKVAIFGGLLVAAPFIFYFVASFVFPALKMREKKYVYRGLGFGVGLFATGVLFCYFVLMPIALSASAKYSEWLGFASDQWRAEEYIGFVCKFMLGMGLGFELPVVVLTLVKIGVLNYSILSKARRYVIVINVTLGALLTTPEVITQVLMALPLQLLYEISVWIAWYWERKEKKRLTAEEAAEAAERAGKVGA
jgi:sec-independent protein translocase protein TatC